MSRAPARRLAATAALALLLGCSAVLSAQVRPYADLSGGLAAWGWGSPCGCSGHDLRAAVGLLLPARLRLGYTYARLATGGSDYALLGLELAYGVFPFRQNPWGASAVELVANAQLRPNGRRAVREGGALTRTRGYAYGAELAWYMFWRKPRARGLYLRGGYVLASETSVRESPGGISSRTRVTHIGWTVRLGYNWARSRITP